MIKLFMVNQARMTCELLAAVLRQEPDIQVVGYATNKDEALTRIGKRSCNTVLVDIGLADGGALHLAESLRQIEPEMKVLIMGLVESKSAIIYCVEEGVDGYILEGESLATLVQKVRAVHEDQFLVSPTVAAALMTRLADLKRMTKELYGISSMHWADDPFTELSPREWEVLLLIERNYSNQEIADELVITTGTAKNHVHNILSKLDVSSRQQAAVLMRQILNEQRYEELGQRAPTSDHATPPRLPGRMMQPYENGTKSPAGNAPTA